MGSSTLTSYITNGHERTFPRGNRPVVFVQLIRKFKCLWDREQTKQKVWFNTLKSYELYRSRLTSDLHFIGSRHVLVQLWLILNRLEGPWASEALGVLAGSV